MSRGAPTRPPAWPFNRVTTAKMLTEEKLTNPLVKPSRATTEATTWIQALRIKSLGLDVPDELFFPGLPMTHSDRAAKILKDPDNVATRISIEGLDYLLMQCRFMIQEVGHISWVAREKYGPSLLCGEAHDFMVSIGYISDEFPGNLPLESSAVSIFKEISPHYAADRAKMMAEVNVRELGFLEPGRGQHNHDIYDFNGQVIFDPNCKYCVYLTREVPACFGDLQKSALRTMGFEQYTPKCPHDKKIKATLKATALLEANKTVYLRKRDFRMVLRICGVDEQHIKEAMLKWTEFYGSEGIGSEALLIRIEDIFGEGDTGQDMGLEKSSVAGSDDVMMDSSPPLPQP